MVRKILHLDLDAFFCSVEELRDPSLRGKPFAVGGPPEQRGVVASCSYAARRFGVRSAMPMSRAVRLCPDLLIVPHDFKAYRAMSAKVMAILHEYTPLVEQISIDEAFLDITELIEPAEQIARTLQKRINTELRLSCSLGVATNKLVAKIANNIGKDAKKKDATGAPPNAIMVVAIGQEASFLAPLPTNELWGVGPKTAENLAALGLHTIGDIARYSEQALIRQFGKNGHDLWLHAQGVDERPLETERETKSVSRETTFVHDVRDASLLRRTLEELCEDLARQLHKEKLRGTTIKIKLRWSDFRTLTRQTTLINATDDEAEIRKAAQRLLDQHRPPEKAVRLLGVGVSHFVEPTTQLSLWDVPPMAAKEAQTAASQNVVPNPKQEKLRSALDALRSRFGEQTVKRASQLKDDER
jgi:DNA polymerase IV